MDLGSLLSTKGAPLQMRVCWFKISLTMVNLYNEENIFKVIKVSQSLMPSSTPKKL
jgi:hypothetical protein